MTSFEELLASVSAEDPRQLAWRGLFAAAARIERRVLKPLPALDTLYPTYLSADGGPRTDTFMGWEDPGLDPRLGARVERSLARAGLVQRVLALLEGELPGQPLDVFLARERGWLVRRPLPEGPSRCAVVGRRGAVLVRLDGERAKLARRLVEWELSGSTTGLVPIDPRARVATPALLALGIAQTSRDRARHLHRQAWTRAGGPWLGIGETESLGFLSTCHLVIDGYAHALLTEALRAGSRDAPRRTDPHLPVPPVSWRDVEPLGVAHTLLEEPPRFPAAAHAFGRLLAEVHLSAEERRAARFSPTFQVPIAPGTTEARRARRVLHALLALRMEAGEPEDLDAFTRRLRPQLERELAGSGLLTRLLSATLRAPLSRSVIRHALASRGRPMRIAPPIAVLGGRGRLSVLRFPAGRAPKVPLLAVSAPGLAATRRDPRGSCVLTLVHGANGTSATLSGTGVAGDHAGASRLLARWRELLCARRENERFTSTPAGG